ncbi:Initiation-specific alpha-1 [Hyphodiscus hymeniophilus]|uniref:Initiation-specific alpha-1 n=1 Tax=Hyphodiscus hymeniophilus TaxID=353542 RepID=A0A9P7AYL2_9HELO|nr:Initiation-specific alpha-1 [Hyphodiscus hymeniophilus]
MKTTSRVPSPFRTALPRQLQRAIPISAVACLLFFLFFRHDSIPSSPLVADAWKRVLSAPAPFTIPDEFPKKIWQTWKVDPLAFEGRDQDRARSWPAVNPTHRYEVLTDGNDFQYVLQHFGPNGLNRPDIVETYRNLTAQIIKADLLRYMVMYIEGGVYADIDVEAIRPIDEWVPERYDPKDVDLVVSVEIDEPNFKDHKILGPKSQSFCQWTFLTKPRVPVMMKLVDHILTWLQGLAEAQNVPISDIELDFDEVITGTGPSAFTNAIIAEMSAKTGRTIDWDYFHALTEPRYVGGILVLTVKAFAAGQGHSNSGLHNATEVLAKHHYHASGWPKKHPRFLHPVYREVELCNWKPDCVRAWDKNTTEFETFPKEKQDAMILEATAKYDAEIEERLAREREDNERAEADRKREERERICGKPEETPKEEAKEEPKEEPVKEEERKEDIPKKEDAPPKEDGPNEDITTGQPPSPSPSP